MQQALALVLPSLAKTRSWPLHEVLITQTWRNTEELTQILVSRRGPSGNMAIGAFMVDLGCLGVQTAYGRVVDAHTYADTRRQISAHQRMIRSDVNLAAKIVREAIAYARELGFNPDPDYRNAMIVLGDADPDACDIEIPVGGSDGKPFYFAGPYDNWQSVINRLTRKLGPDGFKYVVPIDPSDVPASIRGQFELMDAGDGPIDDDESG